jgi:hypothetical protein
MSVKSLCYMFVKTPTLNQILMLYALRFIDHDFDNHNKISWRLKEVLCYSIMNDASIWISLLTASINGSYTVVLFMVTLSLFPLKCAFIQINVFLIVCWYQLWYVRQVSNTNNTTGTIGGAGTACPCGASEFTLILFIVARSLFFCV